MWRYWLRVIDVNVDKILSKLENQFNIHIIRTN